MRRNVTQGGAMPVCAGARGVVRKPVFYVQHHHIVPCVLHSFMPIGRLWYAFCLNYVTTNASIEKVKGYMPIWSI